MPFIFLLDLNTNPKRRCLWLWLHFANCSGLTSELFLLSVAIFTSQYHAFYTPAVGVVTNYAHTPSEQFKSAVWIPTGGGSSSVFFALLPRKVTGLAAAHASGGACLAPGQRALPAAPGHWRSAGSQTRHADCSHSHSELHSGKPSSAVIYFRKPIMENKNGNNRNNTNLYKAH